jgi:hypothetical protein
MTKVFKECEKCGKSTKNRRYADAMFLCYGCYQGSSKFTKIGTYGPIKNIVKEQARIRVAKGYWCNVNRSITCPISLSNCFANKKVMVVLVEDVTNYELYTRLKKKHYSIEDVINKVFDVHCGVRANGSTSCGISLSGCMRGLKFTIKVVGEQDVK